MSPEGGQAVHRGRGRLFPNTPLDWNSTVPPDTGIVAVLFGDGRATGTHVVPASSTHRVRCGVAR